MAEVPNFYYTEMVLERTQEFLVNWTLGFQKLTNFSPDQVNRIDNLRRSTGYDAVIFICREEGIDSYCPSFDFLIREEFGLGLRGKYNRAIGLKAIRGSLSHIGMVVNPQNLENPYMLTHSWEAEEAEVTKLRIVSDGTKVVQISQRTRNGLLFRGPHPQDDFTPEQSIRISFEWGPQDHLLNCSVVLTVLGHEDDVHLVASSSGAYFPHGRRLREYHLPEELPLANIVGNIIDQKPAFYEIPVT